MLNECHVGSDLMKANGINQVAMLQFFTITTFKELLCAIICFKSKLEQFLEMQLVTFFLGYDVIEEQPMVIFLGKFTDSSHRGIYS